MILENSELCATALLYKAALSFEIESEPAETVSYGSGHINDTFLVTCDSGRRYVLQRINTDVFPDPAALASNIAMVTAHIASKTIRSGGDAKRDVLRPVPASAGGYIFKDFSGGVWRAFDCVEGAVSIDEPRSISDVYQCGMAFGNFGKQLADFPAEKLSVVLPDFHNTRARYDALMETARRDPLGRAGTVFSELAFAEARKEETELLWNSMLTGELPTRVIHGDTKLNNVLFDKSDGRAMCVVDLDTVMPGLAAFDFGDAVRCGASSAPEDEGDISKVFLDMERYEACIHGYLEGWCGRLTLGEMRSLPLGAKMMTFECGMRFLEDYIAGDRYFKTDREDQNLDRCHSQFALVMDMERQWNKLRRIAEKYEYAVV